jgi:hypothetical protein
VNAAAGWFNKLFPLSGAQAGKEGEGEGRRSVTFLPQGVREAVDKAIQQSLVDFSVEVRSNLLTYLARSSRVPAVGAMWLKGHAMMD